MEKIVAPTSLFFPTVDLSPFMEGGDESLQKEVIETISDAYANKGGFLVQIDADSFKHCKKLLELSKTFFNYSEEEKKEATKKDKDHSGAGYGKFKGDKFHDCEYVLMHTPGINCNGVPTSPKDYRETFDEVFTYFVKISQILEEIFNGCMGLPPNTLKKYNNDRTWDLMLPMYYTESKEPDDIGIVEHQDPGMVSLVLQDDVSGLEFFIDGKWVPVVPQSDKLVVIVADLMQILSNKKVRHVKHRALKNDGHKRLAIDFCYNFGHKKWIEPLHVLMGDHEMGVKPKYKGFTYSEYADLVGNDYRKPPDHLSDFADIKRYEI